jgi:hypothetical protein
LSLDEDRLQFVLKSQSGVYICEIKRIKKKINARNSKSLILR